MSIVTVLTPHGRRQTVRLQPNQTCMHILDEVCRKHDLTAADYELIHHRRVLDLTLMFRFAGLPNNAQLEMQPATRQRTVDADVTLMLQLESGQRVQGNFAPDTTVAEIVRSLCPADVLQSPASSGAVHSEPVCVYMRTELWGERLAATTLRSLGLTGGRAAIRLMHKDPAALRVQANVSAPLPQRPAEVSEHAVWRSMDTFVAEPAKEIEKDNVPVPTTAPDVGTSSAAAAAADARAAALITTPAAAGDDSAMDVDDGAVGKSQSPCPVDRKKLKINTEECKESICNATSINLAAKEAPVAAAAAAAAEPAPTPPPPVVHVLGPRSAVIFSLDACQLAGELATDDSFYEVSVNDLKVLLRDLKCQARGQDDAPLLTARMRELDESQRTLQKLALYRRTVIRVQFGDRLVLQGVFAPVDRVGDVREWVRSFLADGAQEFDLFTTPPKQILADETTMVEAHCVPTAVLHFGGRADATTTVLKSEFAEKLTSPVGAVLEASKQRGLHGEPTIGLLTDEDGAVGGGSQAHDADTPRRQLQGAAHFKTSTAGGALGDAKMPKWFKPVGK